MFLLRIFIASLALGASLRAGDHALADTSAPPAASGPWETALAKQTDASPKKNETVTRPEAPSKAHPTNPGTSSAGADAGAPDTLDFPQESSSRNPWLYIIVGFLLVTGFLLYVDPRIF